MERMLGKYKMLEVKGTGSFGTLWLAEDIWLERRLALKIPHAKNGDLRKLLSEPKLLAALDHPHIVRLITVDQVEKTLMVVMEFIDGADLRTILARESLPLSMVIDLTKQMLSALSYAHGKGVVHRDLKPTNVLVTKDWQVKVTDFGTAIAHSDGDTEKEGPAGTLAYMSKDQLMGQSGPPSDVYSVGVMLYEMVTGHLPFSDPVSKILVAKILKETPFAPRKINPRIPVEFERIILKAMEKEVPARYASASQMLKDIEALPPEVVSAQIRTPTMDESSEAPTIEIGRKKAVEEAPQAKTLTALWTQGYEYTLTSVHNAKGREDGQFVSPIDVAVDERGHVYVLDSMRCDVQVFDPAFKFLYKFGGPRRGASQPASEAQFVSPYAVDIDREGHLVVVDSRSCQIQRIDREGKVLARYGGPFYLTPGRHESSVKGFNNPRDLAVDKRGQVFVVDTGNNRVAVFSSTGEPRFKFGAKGTRRGDFNSPVSVAVDESNRVLVLDMLNFCVKIFGSSGEFRDSFGSRGTGDSEFDRPARMAVDKEGNIYVLDRGRVKIFRQDGQFFASLSPDKDGAPPSELAGLAIGKEGALYLADTRGVQIIKYELLPGGRPRP